MACPEPRLYSFSWKLGQLSNLDKLVDRVRLKEEGIGAVHQAGSEGGRILGAARCREDKCGVAGLGKRLRVTDKIAHLVQIKFTTYKDDAIVGMCTGKLSPASPKSVAMSIWPKRATAPIACLSRSRLAGAGSMINESSVGVALAHSIPLHSLSEKSGKA